MSSEIETLKTNEFQRRRKLRLQQVRDQSKDIAKKIRQRAKVEKLKTIFELDARKEADYLKRQEKLVKELEVLYAQRVRNIGSGHYKAGEQALEDNQVRDLSKARGKEATAQLRLERQQKLDQQKKLLDRKLQAREAANELSREKSKSVYEQLQAKSSASLPKPDPKANETGQHNINKVDDKTKQNVLDNEQAIVSKNDMATQWDYDKLPKEWEPEVPHLTLPREDNDSLKESNTNLQSSPKKRLNLFAVSEEMPLSIRTKPVTTSSDCEPIKPALTIVSEYLQNRNLRLRQHDTHINKKRGEDLQSIKETILKTRASKAEGIESGLCRVHDEQVVPMPVWQPGSCHFCSSKTEASRLPDEVQDIAPKWRQYEMSPNPVLRGPSPFMRSRACPTMFSKITVSGKNANTERTQHTNVSLSSNKKTNVTVYNHSTKDSKTLQTGERHLVVHETPSQEDAYSSAVKETTSEVESRNNEKALTDMRGKIAVTKNNVEKEYHDTMAFLNSLPREMGARPNKYAFMDESRQQKSRQSQQLRMQQEYKKIEKECRKQCSRHAKCKEKCHRRQQRSPPDDDLESEPPSYSWLPVPEDATMAVHTVKTQPEKSNTVKFSKVDTYHEYRSRHKHTPPTKDDDKQRKFEKVIIQDQTSDHSSTDESFADLNIEKNQDMSDAERIIIYKIIDSKRKKKAKGSVKSAEGKGVKNQSKDNGASEVLTHQLSEGVYKRVSETGDNMSSMYYADKTKEGDNSRTRFETSKTCPRGCYEKEKGVPVEAKWDINNAPPDGKQSDSDACKCCGYKPTDATSDVASTTKTVPSESVLPTTSTTTMSSFKTAYPDDKSENGFIKVVNDTGRDTGKLYIDPKGLLRDDDFEVVIQLRKKGKRDEEVTASDVTTKIGETRKSGEQSAVTSDAAVGDNIVTSDNKVSVSVSVPEVDENCDTNKANVSADREETKAQQESKQNNDNVEVPVKLVEVSSKPSSSTYTQTVSRSPVPRPHYHMSSSTSTAYMSPPDTILPKLLRKDLVTTYDEAYDESEEKTNRRRYHKKHVVCSCHDCHTDRHERHRCSKVERKTRILQTPPNTARSYNDQVPEKDEPKVHKVNRKTSVHSSPLSKKKRCKCKRCESSASNKQSLKKSKSQQTVIPSRRNSKNVSINKKSTKSKLNPAIKSYVNKLLTLSKEGLKAMEVMTKECSSVTTPSSSIINIETNTNKSKPTLENKISLEQLKNLLKENIIENYVRNVENIYSKGQPKKPVHKVKSLNISKNLSRRKSTSSNQSHKRPATQKSSTSTKDEESDKFSHLTQAKSGQDGSDTLDHMNNINNGVKDFVTDTDNNTMYSDGTVHTIPFNTKVGSQFSATTSSTNFSEERVIFKPQRRHRLSKIQDHSDNGKAVDIDINMVKRAESKIENMEKIADLTEKCTQRLSNLAKVLEEVRKNKSMVYSQISTSDTSSEPELRANIPTLFKSASTMQNVNSKSEEKLPTESLLSSGDNQCEEKDYVCLLKDIPKPIALKPDTFQLKSPKNKNNDKSSECRSRPKPPPALSRMRHKQEDVVPHELSTVVEVDSPMSIKLKGPNGNKSTSSLRSIQETKPSEEAIQFVENPDLLQRNKTSSKQDKNKNYKVEMMDINKFNEIMLKPFVSIEEFAKRCDAGVLDEQSNIEEIPKDDSPNDELSSLHSEGSLPDVIGELLKRNIIKEPFKFDVSGANSVTTVSSDSTLSTYAKTKIRKEKRLTSTVFQDKENKADSSDSLSMSSNPDLENAFKKIGMRWASSTLKKTKERLALSSSSSSTSQSYKPKHYEKQDPLLQEREVARKPLQIRNDFDDSSKNVEQQTSIKTMTVQEFLNNELSKKITFSNKSQRNETEPEFISLYETKMPEELKNSQGNRDEQSLDQSSTSNQNRARTSTPVQLFKSLAYHSSSSSNNASNGLFSNADDLSSVKVTSSSMRNHSTSDKDDLTVPNYSLKLKKDTTTDPSKSD